MKRFGLAISLALGLVVTSAAGGAQEPDRRQFSLSEIEFNSPLRFSVSPAVNDEKEFYDYVITVRGIFDENSSNNFTEFLVKSGIINVGLLGTSYRTEAFERARILVKFNSPGGLVVQAVAIGRSIRRMGFDAQPEGRCASACSYAILGGVYRFYPHNSTIEVHQLSAAGGDIAAATQSGASLLTEYATEMTGSAQLIQKASQTKDVVVLSQSEAKQMRVINNGIGDVWDQFEIVRRRASLVVGRTDRLGEVVATFSCDMKDGDFFLTITKKQDEGIILRHLIEKAMDANSNSEVSTLIAGSQYRDEWWRDAKRLRIYFGPILRADSIRNTQAAISELRELMDEQVIRPTKIKEGLFLPRDYLDQSKYVTLYFDKIKSFPNERAISLTIFDEERQKDDVLVEFEFGASSGKIKNFFDECNA